VDSYSTTAVMFLYSSVSSSNLPVVHPVFVGLETIDHGPKFIQMTTKNMTQSRHLSSMINGLRMKKSNSWSAIFEFRHAYSACTTSENQLCCLEEQDMDGDLVTSVQPGRFSFTLCNATVKHGLSSIAICKNL